MATTIVLDTSLDVVDKYRELVLEMKIEHTLL